jgi:hypothetical protein
MSRLFQKELEFEKINLDRNFQIGLIQTKDSEITKLAQTLEKTNKE